MRLASKIATCLVEVVLSCPVKSTDLTLVKNTLLLAKSLEAGVWYNSEFVCKQMDKVGVVLSKAVATAGYKNLASLANANPRMLELAARKAPPFGNNLRDWASSQPRYSINVRLGHVSMTSVQLEVRLSLENREQVVSGHHGGQHRWVMLAGSGISVLGVSRGYDTVLMSSEFSRNISMTRTSWEEDRVEVSLISLSIVGVDSSVSVNIPRPAVTSFTSGPGVKDLSSRAVFMSQFRRECKHQCLDKKTCKHECCKEGASTPITPRKRSLSEEVSFMKKSFTKNNSFNSFNNQTTSSTVTMNNVINNDPVKFSFKQVSNEPHPRDENPASAPKFTFRKGNNNYKSAFNRDLIE